MKKEYDVRARNIVVANPKTNPTVQIRYPSRFLKAQSKTMTTIKRKDYEFKPGTNLEKAELAFCSLSNLTLHGANLRRADLQGANLTNTGLSNADLSKAKLSEANLSQARLRGAKLCEASLIRANLSNTDLSYADLSSATLAKANLSGATLIGTNFNGANLIEADLTGAIFNHSTIGIHPAPEGDLIGYKKVAGHLIKLRVPAEAKRSCGTTRKYRAEYAEVIEIVNSEETTVVNPRYNQETVYTVGCLVIPDSWDDNRWNECSHGIHFFLSKEEAEAWPGY